MLESGGEGVGQGAAQKGIEGVGSVLAREGSQALATDLPHFLAETAERGKGVLVNQILLGMSSGQRIDMLRQMDLINEMHRKTNHNLPDLVIDYNKQGYSVAVDYPGTKDDMVIVSAKVNKYDEVTNVTCNTAKELPITRGHGKIEPVPGPRTGGDGPPVNQRQGQDQQPRQKKGNQNGYQQT